MSDLLLTAFAALAANRRDRPLVVSARRRATVGEVDALAGALAGRLTGSGAAQRRLQPGAAVALAAADGPGFLAAWLALRRLGAVPLLVDAATPPAARRRLAAALGARLLVEVDDAWPEAAGTRVETVPGAATLALPAGTAAVKLTSGSTGEPRGVAVSCAALLADDAQLTASMGLGPEDRLLVAVPLSHSYGLSSLAVPALARGVTLVLPEERSPLAPLAPLTAARDCAATFLPTVPAWLSALVRLAAPPPLPPSLRLVISAGAPLPPATAARFREIYGQPVHVFYGASECGGIAYDRDGGAGERGTVGTPVEGVRVELEPLDPPEPDRGRVTVTSAAVALGTVPDPDARLGGGRFRTGDLGAWDGGELRLRGRADDLVIVRGRNVDPREVEAVLRALPGVEDVAVLALPGAAGEPVLRAVLACPRGPLDYARVAAHCRERLPDHKVPRSLVFVAELPRTARGKLDRAALAAL